jgi:hypothetical protein
LTQGEKRAEAEAILVKLNWSVPQARAIVAGLAQLPPWQYQTTWRWPLLWDWSSSNGHLDPTALEIQIKFLSVDLRNALDRVGKAGSQDGRGGDESLHALCRQARRMNGQPLLTATSPTRNG